MAFLRSLLFFATLEIEPVFDMENKVSKTSNPVSVAFILSPAFTMGAFANFIDALRLAADDDDSSRQIRCRWSIMSHDGQPIVASCGLEVLPNSALEDPAKFDYIVVVGGLLKQSKSIPSKIISYLQQAAEKKIPLIGLCTGSFILARAGLMSNAKSCVSWFHYDHFVEEFPRHPVSAEELFIVDNNRLTCAGGVGAVHLAAYIIEKHFGKAEATKALRIMQEEMPLPANTLQPQALVTKKVDNQSVKKAMLLIEKNITTPLPMEEIARQVYVSPRHLERLFQKEIGLSPSSYSLKLRLHRAKSILTNTNRLISSIAIEVGFVDFSHFSRCFKAEFGVSPSKFRGKNKA